MGVDAQSMDSDEDKELFEKIYKEQRQYMYRVARRIIGQMEEAENVVHDAFLKIVEEFDTYKQFPESEMRGICITIAKCKAIDLWRKKKPVLNDDMDAMYLVEGRSECIPEEAVRRKEIGEEVRNALDQLPDVIRETMVLKYYYQLTNHEISRLLEVPVKTVDMRLYRGRMKLKEMLEDKEGEP